MSDIYFDESGQIGGDLQKTSVSKNFYCALLITDNSKEIERIVKKNIRGFSPKQLNKFSGTLHAYKELDRTRTKLLKYLANTDAKIVLFCADKRKLQTKYPMYDDVAMYQYAVSVFIKKLADDCRIDNSDRLILSRYFSKHAYNEKLKDMIVKARKYDECLIVPAANNRCLQAVDFVAWAYNVKNERGVTNFFDIYAEKIIAEYKI